MPSDRALMENRTVQFAPSKSIALVQPEINIDCGYALYLAQNGITNALSLV
jgi:hypothetical protein